MGAVRADGEPGSRRTTRVNLDARIRQGRARVRSSAYPIVQAAVAVAVAATTARFLDRGVTFTTQAGVQALVIVGLPSLGASGGGFGRWTDAAVGGAVALAVTALTPSDPRRPVRAQSRAATIELVGMLRTLAPAAPSGPR
jgi:hypothetical protein